MITDEKLIEYNKRGLIPGPSETNEQFYQRVDFCEKFFLDPSHFFSDFSLNDRVTRQDLDWVYAKLIKTYDIAPDYLVAFYSNKNLYFFQGACTWIFEHKDHPLAVVQLRSRLKDKKYFFYDREEILTHEVAHLARMAFEEKSEEVFAYLLSSSFFRRSFGAIIENEKEVLIFFFSFFISLLCFIFSFNFLLAFSALSTSCIFLWGLFRLFKKKWRLKLAAKKLLKLVKRERWVRAILFRMTDKEIALFASWNAAMIFSYIKKQKSLRWRMIYLSYFSKSKQEEASGKKDHNNRSQKRKFFANVQLFRRWKHFIFSKNSI